jgi:hypothetical protein
MDRKTKTPLFPKHPYLFRETTLSAKRQYETLNPKGLPETAKDDRRRDILYWPN